VRLIADISIRRFRSINDLSIGTEALTALVGGNGSGKSNVLRALSLYFNGEVEPGDRLELHRDVYRPWNKKAPVIDVGVRFTLPATFAIHTSIREGLKAIGIEPGASFWLMKRWRGGASPDEPPVVEIRLGADHDATAEGPILESEESRAAEQFLRLIHFRYLPNHVHPSEVLAAEQASVQEALIKALRRRRRRDPSGEGAAQRFDAALEAMAEAAQALVEPINSALGSGSGSIESFQLATPDAWEQVVWSLAFQLKASDLEAIDFSLHGSGSQAQAMYQLLYALDSRYSASFGWHQATVWAIEEPESFLHADLRNELVVFFLDKTSEPRFQALLTTHDLVIAAAAGVRQWIHLDAGDSQAEALTSTELAARSISEGVSTFVHPLHLTAMKPTLLLEGPYDVWYVSEAYRHAGRTNPWDIRYLDDIEQGAGGGKESLKKYLKANQAALKARPAQSPVVVVLDWEVTTSETNSVNELVSVHPTSSATRWPSDKANPDLGESWVGIERFLGTRLVSAVASDHPDAGITTTVGEPPRWELAPQRKNQAKQLLLAECRTRDDPDDVWPIIDSLDWLEQQLPTPGAQLPIPAV
jgi:hypothetical protein